MVDQWQRKSVRLTSQQMLGVQRLRVLVVGQSNSLGNILTANITCWGYEVVAVPSLASLCSSEVQGDILLYDLDEALRIAALGTGQGRYPDEAALCEVTRDIALSGQRSHARLLIVLGSCSISRDSLEQMGAVAFLYKPFEMGRLQHYLRVLQQLLQPGITCSQPGYTRQRLEGPLQVSLSELHTVYADMETGKRKTRVLVVDDVVEVVEAVRQYFMDEPGYEVEVAYDGLEALEKCVTWQPQCIVTDLIMPWMNGYQVMHCLASSAHDPMPAFVVMSALNPLELPVHRPYLNSQVVAYVDKPFHLDDIFNAVEQALISRKRMSIA